MVSKKGTSAAKPSHSTHLTATELSAVFDAQRFDHVDSFKRDVEYVTSQLGQLTTTPPHPTLSPLLPGLYNALLRALDTPITRPLSLVIARRFLQPTNIKILYRALSAGAANIDACANVVRLITAIVSTGSGVLTQEAKEGISFSLKAFSKLLNMRRKDATDTPVRTLTIDFFLSFFVHGDAKVKTQMMELRELLMHIVQGLNLDDIAVVAKVFSVYYDHIIMDKKVTKTSKVEFFNAKVLENISKLYGRTEAEEGVEHSVAEIAHNFLYSICCHRGAGICFADDEWYPRSDRAGQTGTSESTSKIRNLTLSTFIGTLRPSDDVRQQALVLGILEACPELVPRFWQSCSLSFDPRPSSKWLANMTLLQKIIAIPPPSFRFANTAYYATTPPPKYIVLENIVPSVVGKGVLAKGLQHSDALVRYVTAGILAIIFRKLESVTIAMTTVGEELKGSVNPSTRQGYLRWHQLVSSLPEDIRRRLPEFQLVVNMHMACPREAAQLQFGNDVSSKSEQQVQDYLVFEATLRLLTQYQTYLPAAVLDSKFDVSKVFPADLTKVNISALASYLQLMKVVPGFNWTARSSDGILTHFGAILSLYIEKSHPHIRELASQILVHWLTGSSIFQRREEANIFFEAIPEVTEDTGRLVVLKFIDECIGRFHKASYHYIDRLMELVSQVDDGLQSKLLAGSEQSGKTEDVLRQLVYQAFLDQRAALQSNSASFYPFSPLMMTIMDQFDYNLQHADLGALEVLSAFLQKLIVLELGEQILPDYIAAYITRLAALLSKVESEKRSNIIQKLKPAIDTVRSLMSENGDQSTVSLESIQSDQLQLRTEPQLRYQLMIMTRQLLKLDTPEHVITKGVHAISDLLIEQSPACSKLDQILSAHPIMNLFVSSVTHSQLPALIAFDDGICQHFQKYPAHFSSHKPRLMMCIASALNLDSTSPEIPPKLQLTEIVLACGPLFTTADFLEMSSALESVSMNELEEQWMPLLAAIFKLPNWKELLQPKHMGRSKIWLNMLAHLWSRHPSDKLDELVCDILANTLPVGLCSTDKFDYHQPITAVVDASAARLLVTPADSMFQPSSLCKKFTKLTFAKSGIWRTALLRSRHCRAAFATQATAFHPDIVQMDKALPLLDALSLLPNDLVTKEGLKDAIDRVAYQWSGPLLSAILARTDGQAASVTFEIFNRLLARLDATDMSVLWSRFKPRELMLHSASLQCLETVLEKDRALAERWPEFLQELLASLVERGDDMHDLGHAFVKTLGTLISAHPLKSEETLETSDLAMELLTTIIPSGSLESEIFNLASAVVDGILKPTGKSNLSEVLVKVIVESPELVYILETTDGLKKLEIPSQEARTPRVRLLKLLHKLALWDFNAFSSHPAYLRPVLEGYRGSTSTSDSIIVSLLYEVERMAKKPLASGVFFFGSAARTFGQSNAIVNRTEILSMLDPDYLEHSCVQFPVSQPMVPAMARDTFSTTTQQVTYDPSFLLPLFAYSLSGPKSVDCRTFTYSGALAFVLCCLSSQDLNVRKAAYSLLEQFQIRLQTDSFKEKSQVELLVYILQSSISIEEAPHMRVPTCPTFVIAEASGILLQPSHFLYTHINKFLLQRVVLDFKDIPMFYSLFNSASAGYKKERRWMLRVLAHGLRCENDHPAYRRRHVWDMLLAFYTSKIADNFNRAAIRELLFFASGIPSVASYLIRKVGLLNWIQSLCLTTLQSDELLCFAKVLLRLQLATVQLKHGGGFAIETYNYIATARVILDALPETGHSSDGETSDVEIHILDQLVRLIHFVSCVKDASQHNPPVNLPTSFWKSVIRSLERFEATHNFSDILGTTSVDAIIYEKPEPTDSWESTELIDNVFALYRQIPRMSLDIILAQEDFSSDQMDAFREMTARAFAQRWDSNQSTRDSFLVGCNT